MRVRQVEGQIGSEGRRDLPEDRAGRNAVVLELLGVELLHGAAALAAAIRGEWESVVLHFAYN